MINPLYTSEKLINSLPEVNNVAVFICDALRYDCLPEEVVDRGVALKTVASSLKTHTSIPTMLTGLEPQRHGVTSWEHRLPRISNLLEQSGYDCGFYHPGDESVLDDGTFAVLRQSERRSVEQLNSPWVYVERHHGGHAPFNAVESYSGSWNDFIKNFSGNPEKLRKWYKRAIASSVDDFIQRVETIQESEEIGDTLIVFCSDHGEYLNETGLVGHSSPIRPECVYVPTVFVHPQLNCDDHKNRNSDGIMRHIDLYPTLLGALSESIPDHISGVDVTKESSKVGCCWANVTTSVMGNEIIFYQADSVWGHNGGMVKHKLSINKRLLSCIGLLLGSGWKSVNIRSDLLSNIRALSAYLKRTQKHGTLPVNKKEVLSFISKRSSQAMVSTVEKQQLTNAQREQLEHLGYL